MSAQQSQTVLARSRPLRSSVTTRAKPAMTAVQSSTTTTRTASSSSSSSTIPPQSQLQSHRVITPTGSPQQQIPTTTSNLSFFLTNLRLLDLDLEGDWPEITSSNFSSKDAASGQKKRIHCVEWALYQLFLLWDPADAQARLKPYFPPADQVQSINLRAALVRRLDTAKRNGVLGRDAVIRKTMLDECKGERLEEVLAVLSSAVLKKLAAEKYLNSGPNYRPTISEKMALESWGYSGERIELYGLILAHKATIAAELARKNVARERYRDFSNLLSLKERELASRKEEQMKVAQSRGMGRTAAIPAKTKAELCHTLRTNWTGNDQWLESLLYTDKGSHKTGLLSSSFEHVWTSVRKGELSDVEGSNAGLLEQLDSRVRVQRVRLERWQGFRKKLFGNKSATEPATPSLRNTRKQKGVDLGFTRHQNLSLDFSSIKKNHDNHDSHDEPKLSTATESLLGSLKHELDALKNPPVADFSKLFPVKHPPQTAPPGLAIPPPREEPISDMSEWEDEANEAPRSKPAAVPSTRHHQRQPSGSGRLRSPKRRPIIRNRSETTTTTTTSTSNEGTATMKKRNVASTSSIITNTNIHPTPPIDQPDRPSFFNPVKLQYPIPRVESPPASPIDEHIHDHLDIVPSPEREPEAWLPTTTPSSPSKKPVPRRTKSARPPSPTQTQAMADQILASISAASPSPVKKPRHRMTLQERTRMSMVRMTSFEADDDEHSPALSPRKPMPLQEENLQEEKDEAGKAKEIEKQQQEAAAAAAAPEDLVARTRRSMANFEASQQRAQLERRRSQREQKRASRALLPVSKDGVFGRLDEEEAAMGDVSVVEELLDQGLGEPDVEAVFRSRPKMRTSPLPSPAPARRWGE